MVIPFNNNGMTPRRNRIIRSFSFRPSDLILLAQGRERVEKHAPQANDSEIVRVALEVLALAPEALIRRVTSTFERVESGRPPALIPPPLARTSAWEEELLDDQGRVRRLAFFEELEMLRDGPRGEQWVESRIETLCRYFGMIYSPPE
jgi:hypothetical protein